MTIGTLPDEYLVEIGPMCKKVALATGVEQYNVLQVCHYKEYISCPSDLAKFAPTIRLEQWQDGLSGESLTAKSRRILR